MSPERAVSNRMRDDWNRRAKEDANYYVAFGRRDQNEDDFYATATEVIAGLEWEMKHLGPTANPRARRALEIGCGPGRLVKLMSPRFGEIHGVDVSDEMIGLAKRRLSGIRHAHVHANDGSTLAQFADDSFDFVYSYAVFQHIPSRDVVLEYCREAYRVMKPGAILRAQFNGLPRDFPTYDTWSGVRFSGAELTAFASEHNFQILSLDGLDTQYTWTTWRKRAPGWRVQPAVASDNTRIRRITNALNSEPVVPARGRYASISLWVEHLPADADILDLAIHVNGQPARITYIGPPSTGALQQVNAILAPLDATGLLPVDLRWRGGSIAPVYFLRVIPPGPQIPRIIAISDGINLTSGTRIETGTFKATLEEVQDSTAFGAAIDGTPARDIEIFCTDPQSHRYEVNFKLPAGVAPGSHVLWMTLGRRKFAPVPVIVAG